MYKQFLIIISALLVCGLIAPAALAEQNFVPGRTKTRMTEANPNATDPTSQKNMVQELLASLPATEPIGLIEK